MQNDHIKSVEEIALMRRAAAITDDVYEYILGIVSEGVTETALADAIYRKTVEMGASGVSFDTIVAFGESGAEPHHVPTDKRLQEGMFRHYRHGCGGGRALLRLYTHVCFRRHRRGAEARLRTPCTRRRNSRFQRSPTVRRAEPRTRRREITIARCGYGEFYIHGTGHGVGTEIHEPPHSQREERRDSCGRAGGHRRAGYLSSRTHGRADRGLVLVGEGRPFSRHTTELITLRQ